VNLDRNKSNQTDFEERSFLTISVVGQVKMLFQKVGSLYETNYLRRVNGIMQRNQVRLDYGNKWFVNEEMALLQILASIIMHSDEHTPGVIEMDVLGAF